MKKQFYRNCPALVAIIVLNLCFGLTMGRTIDEIIADSTSSGVTSNDLNSDAGEQVIRSELDMLLTVEQYVDLYDNQSDSASNISNPLQRKKRKATRSLTKRWTNKIIPYSIDNSIFSSRDIAEINKAIEEWETYTCIRFRRANNGDYRFVVFRDGEGCSSSVGMLGGRQSINLADGCRYKQVIAHEIGHAVGFFHEQNRPDRDDYVIIKKENIRNRNLYSNFDKYSTRSVSTYDVQYDYKSIMHYGARAFSRNRQYTIVTIDPTYQEIIGNSKGLSFKDIKLANLMYRCSEGCQSSITCPKEGFLGKDCRCWCPGNPVQICEGTNVLTRQPTVKSTVRSSGQFTTRPGVIFTFRSTNRPTTRSTPVTCQDTRRNCPKWARYGLCQISGYIRANCKVSCLLCGNIN